MASNEDPLEKRLALDEELSRRFEEATAEQVYPGNTNQEPEPRSTESLARQAVRDACDEQADVSGEGEEEAKDLPDEQPAPPPTKDAQMKADESTSEGAHGHGPSKRSSNKLKHKEEASEAGTESSTAQGDPRLLKARYKAVQEELGKANRELSDKEQRLARAEKAAKESQSEKEALQKQLKQVQAHYEKSKKRNEELKETLQERERELSEAKEELDKVSREVKSAEQGGKSREARLNRALEEVERYKRLLQEAKQQQKHGGGGSGQDGEAEKLRQEKRRLEQQKSELLAAFKKQMKLIDVLRRQKSHLQAARALQFTEEEYLRLIQSSDSSVPPSA